MFRDATLEFLDRFARTCLESGIASTPTEAEATALRFSMAKAATSYDWPRLFGHANNPERAAALCRNLGIAGKRVAIMAGGPPDGAAAVLVDALRPFVAEAIEFDPSANGTVPDRTVLSLHIDAERNSAAVRACGSMRFISPLEVLAGILDLSQERRATAQSLATIACEQPDLLLYYGPGHTPQIHPTFKALRARGQRILFLTTADISPQAAAEIADVSCRDADETLLWYLLRTVTRGTWWIFSEAFWHPHWDMGRSAICYAYAAAAFRMARTTVVNAMYDGIKPVVRGFEYEAVSFASYRTLMSASDAILFNSNTPTIGTLISNAVAPGVPALAHYRYGEAPRRRHEPPEGEFHLVALTVLFDEVFEPARAGMDVQIRLILDQGIHIHYFERFGPPKRFMESLTAEQAGRFHLEPQILDQATLAEAASRCHAAFVIGDFAGCFSGIVSRLQDPTYRSIMSCFIGSTVPTWTLVAACAGIPVLLPRAFEATFRMFPAGCAIPLDLPEIPHLREILRRTDLREARRRMVADAGRFTATERIDPLLSFLHHLHRCLPPPQAGGNGPAIVS